jgi:FkbM family methyltransferase
MSGDPVFPQPSYSAFGEDRLIEYLLRDRGPGYYVDVGCCWPIAFSNTYLLYKHGWRGLAIDADPEFAEPFRLQRPGDVFVNAAVGLKRGHAMLRLFSDPSMNATDPGWAAAAAANPHKRSLGEVEVERWPLGDLIARHAPAGVVVEFMNIDCEGADLEALQSNDWSRFSPRMLAVEDPALDLETATGTPIRRFLAALGYRLTAKLHLTSIYALD